MPKPPNIAQVFPHTLKKDHSAAVPLVAENIQQCNVKYISWCSEKYTLKMEHFTKKTLNGKRVFFWSYMYNILNKKRRSKEAGMKDHTGETSPEEANVIQDWIEPRAALHRAQRRRLL